MANTDSESNVRAQRKSNERERFSTTEKMLFAAAISGFFICVTLLIGLGIMVGNNTACNKNSTAKIQKREAIQATNITEIIADILSELIKASNKETCNKVCTSQVCQNEAIFFKNLIDESVDPCDDFYQFACGKFIRNAVIPNDESKIDMMSITQNKVMDELVREIKGEIREDELNAFKMMKIYYSNCMNTTLINQEGTETLLNALNHFGGWPVLLGDSWNYTNYSWIESLYKAKDYGYPMAFPAYVYIGIDSKNSTKNVIKIINASVRIKRTFLSDGPKNKLLKAYYNYMVDVAVMLGANRDIAIRDMKQSLDFEINLYNIRSSIEQLMDTTAIYNPITVKELSKKHLNIPWLEFLNRLFNPVGIEIDENEVVILNDLKFIQEIGKLIEKTPNRVLANYLMWQIVADSIDYLPDRFLDRKLILSRVVHGVQSRTEPSFSCVKDVMNSFPLSLSALYVRKYFNKDIRESVLDVVWNIKNQFRKMLENVDWMDRKTRAAALEKIDSMDVFVGYTDELFDDEKLDDYYKGVQINYGSYLKSAFNVSEFVMNQYYKTLRQPVNKKDWRDNKNAAIINAYYYIQKNTFEIPAGILRGSFFHFARPKYLNYGAIGSIIGHEITHGFDNEGRKSDKNGNQVDWWDSNTKEKYLHKASCIVEQYSNFTVPEVGLSLNGNRTQGENIADNGGFKTAYYAYNEWSKRTGINEPCLPELNYTPRQMFWISGASSWCRKQKIEYLNHLISTDEHTPPAARVLISYSNIEEFSKDFSCKLGSRMNPVKKCIVW